MTVRTFDSSEGSPLARSTTAWYTSSMRKKINTGVTLEPDVAAYLADLAKREDRDRSWLINAIVREHSTRQTPSKSARASRSVAPAKKQP